MTCCDYSVFFIFLGFSFGLFVLGGAQLVYYIKLLIYFFISPEDVVGDFCLL